MLLELATIPFLFFLQENQEKKETPPQDDRTVWEILADDHDKNGDGKITLEEYGNDKTRFERLDGNGDGVITEEDAAALGTRRGRRSGGGGQRPARPQAPEAGTVAPDFSLPLLGAKKPTEVKLSSFRGKKPVALIFGSYT